MKLPLREYNNLIEDLISKGNGAEALDHCQHILLEFPRYLETRRLLGKTYLELGDYLSSEKVFINILNDFPNDFASNVGLGIINDEKQKIDIAIWHMERAFETQPSNPAIQAELQRLYGLRDKKEPLRIRMTRGALAKVYLDGELFSQAIAELKSILSQEPQRADIKNLLGYAYFKIQSYSDASLVCTELLQTYPYCFDANRIMYEITRINQNSNKSDIYLKKVVSLDPYAAFTKDLSIFKSYEVAESKILIEKLDNKTSLLTRQINLSNTNTSEEIVFISNTEQEEALNSEASLRVFLCHASDDKPQVRKIYHFLKEQKTLKIDPWLDEEKLEYGDEWDLKIRKAVRETHLVLVCLSKNSITKEGYVQKEIREALDTAQEKPPGTVYIIPIRLEECEVPDRLRHFHWLNYYEDRADEKLLKSLKNRAKDFGIV